MIFILSELSELWEDIVKSENLKNLVMQHKMVLQNHPVLTFFSGNGVEKIFLRKTVQDFLFYSILMHLVNNRSANLTDHIRATLEQ